MADARATERALPHNPGVERTLIGAILLDNNAFDSVADFVGPEHFENKFHARLFEAIRGAIRAGKIAAIDTIKDLLSLPGNYQVCGTSLDFYLNTIMSNACSIYNAKDYGRQIRDLAVRRELIILAEEIKKDAYAAPADAIASTQIQSIEQKLYSLAESHIPNSGFMPFDEVLASALKLAAEAYAREGKLAGVSTGFKDFDSYMGGLQRSDLIIIGGRPGMGKTALVTNIAYNIAKAWTGREDDDGKFETFTGGRVGFFSLEMSADQIGTRIISDVTSIDSSKIRRGSFTDHEFVKMRDAERDIGHIPLFIDHTGGLSVAQVCSRARRLKRKRGLDLLVIDYLQLMTGGKRQKENRVQELTEITSSLKALAKELNVPIVALSQLSRQVENRDDKRPQLNDLRESGSIEQDADVVLFVFREAYYLDQRQPKEETQEHLQWQEEMSKLHNKVEVLFAKQRHGMTGKIDMHFDRFHTKFSDAVKPDQMPDNYGPINSPPAGPEPWEDYR